MSGKFMKPIGNNMLKNIFKFLDKENPPTKAFVTVSLLLLFVFILFFLFLFGYSNKNIDNKNNLNNYNTKLDIVDVSDDPYITYFKDISDENQKPQISKYDPKYGDKNPQINIVYFGDYDCDYCLQQINTIKEVVDESSENIQLIWKDYPDSDQGSISFKAALAGRCAQSQNKFWPFLQTYSDQYPIFNSQSGLNKQEFDNFIFGLAEAIDLNIRKFKSCYNNKDHSDVLEYSIQESQSLGLKGVPYTYINDNEILGEIDKDSLEDEIDLILNR